MIVYKFGGASVRNAGSVRKLAEIIRICKEPLVVVVSAMGKTTNRLEALLDESLKENGDFKSMLSGLLLEHQKLVSELLDQRKKQVSGELGQIVSEIAEFMERNRNTDYNFLYDQVVSAGELMSTKIVSAFLSDQNIPNRWIDIRQVIRTDDNYRDARVDHRISQNNCREIFGFSETNCYLTQGFIGADEHGFTTTLGREGSDYTAALIANYLDANGITLWKDVPGIFNADPAMFENSEQIPALSYQEVIELTYYGAKVIHPKTLKPLYDKGIPLFVKSFNEPVKEGTVVLGSAVQNRQVPFTILKEQQILISISNKDLSFVSEMNVSVLFRLLNNFRLKANLMQHSAISFSVCVDRPRGKEVTDLVTALRKDFKVLYNENLKLITIRNYSEAIIKKLIHGKKIMVEQRSRHTVQFVLD